MQEALARIEENNTSLKALRATLEARKLDNRTGIYLPGPEAEFNYFWGSPAAVGRRADIRLSQTFDIPTLTGMKSKVADRRNGLEAWRYKAERLAILLEAQQYCIELVYYNALAREWNARLAHAETIERGYASRLEQGEEGRLEYNKARMNLSVAREKASRIAVEQEALRQQLTRLNGGIELRMEAGAYEGPDLPPDFETWYAEAEERNPVLAYARQEIEVGRQEVSLGKALGLPSFSTGYVSEQTPGQRYQGFTLGIAIPLWANKNQVRRAKASLVAAQTREADSRQQFRDRLRMLYGRAAGLLTAVSDYRRSLASADATELLSKALASGRISLLDYVLELGLYYEATDRLLETERDYRLALAELTFAGL
jgi:outer membrane protein TolC